MVDRRLRPTRNAQRRFERFRARFPSSITFSRQLSERLISQCLRVFTSSTIKSLRNPSPSRRIGDRHLRHTFTNVMSKRLRPIRAKRGSNEYRFWKYKAHTYVSGLHLERQSPKNSVLEQVSDSVLKAWREWRAHTIGKLRQKLDLEAIHSRNLHEFGDCIGPTWEYFNKRTEKTRESLWRHVVEEFVRYNGPTGMERMLGQHIAELPADSFYPHAMAQFLDTPLTWQPTGDALRPWVTAVASQILTVQVNAFPDEYLFGFLFDNGTVCLFNDWPPHWVRLRKPEHGRRF